MNVALVIHHHQPSGNLEDGVRRAVESAYRPTLELLEAHAQLRVNLHYSGAILGAPPPGQSAPTALTCASAATLAD